MVKHPLDWSIETFFEQSYATLHSGANPYPWQSALFGRLFADDWPPVVTAPTGAGKTSLITIWLLALAAQAKLSRITIPRRLVWVVNRRVVVDQATDEAERLRERLTSSPQCSELREALQPIVLPSTGNDLLAVSTLRGERADNRDWVRDPSRPALIIGTVDMVGSRLLFSGYGDSRKVRAHHAADRAGRTHHRHAGSRFREHLQHRSGDAAQEVENEESRPRHGVFDIVSEQPEEPHVAQQMHPGPVHEHRREDVQILRSRVDDAGQSSAHRERRAGAQGLC